MVKFDGTNWTNYNPNNSPLKDNTVTGLNVYNNTVWTSSYGHGLYKFDGSNWVNYAAANSGILNDYTYCVTTDNSGNIWVGISNGNVSNSGVVKFNGLTTWTPYSFFFDYNYRVAEAIAVDKQGNIWCGTRVGVFKFNGTDWNHYTKENTSGGLCGNVVREINVDASGNVWFGCMDKDPATGYWIEGGLSKFTGTTWSSYKPSGGGLTNGNVSAIDFNPTDVKETESIPTSFMLNQNYPNPFNPETVISYQLPVSSFVTLKVYDALGRQVATLVNEFQTAGIHNSTFSTLSSALTSGIYFYKLQSGSFVDVKKMMLVK